MAENFQFHYVRTKTGSISGQMVMQQTEDAINDLGEYIFDVNKNANEALRTANEAIETANTASTNASTALQTANSAIQQVNTLSVTVNSWNARITTAEGNAQNAVTTANSALSSANQAVDTANSALTAANRAVSTANGAVNTANSASQTASQANSTATSALETANNAIDIANNAVTDTEAIREEVKAAVNQVNQAVSNATSQAQNAATSASAASDSASTAEKWATKVDNTAPESEPADYTVDGEGYSAKWNANLAQAWAVKMDGQVTENNIPGGTAVDYSAKYYAQQAGSSATAAASSASTAASSEANAKTSETNAKASETAAKTSETNAKTSETNAASSASAAEAAQKAAEAAQTAAESAKDSAISATKGAVLYSAQTLTSAQQTQARTNIGALGKSENAATATKLANKRTIKLTGGATASLQFDGSGDASATITLTVMKGATSSAAGALGAVPAPAAGAQGKFLRGDATWQDPTSACVKTSGNQTISGTKTFSVAINSSIDPNSWVNAANGQTLINSTLVNGDFVPLWQYETTDGDSFVLAGLKTNLQIAVVTSENKASGTNSSKTIFSLTPDGGLSLTGAVKASSFSGNATSASKLATARAFRTNLASTATANFDGSGDATPGVTGVLPIANGGTGNANGTVAKLTTARNIQVNLASTAAASFNGSADAKPGVTGTLPIGNGGTGRTDGHAPKDILMSGSRGNLAGYENLNSTSAALTVNASTRDSSSVTGAVTITVSNGASGQSWTKTIGITNASAKVSLGSSWKWMGGSTPTISANGVLVVHWCGTFGIANFVASR